MPFFGKDDDSNDSSSGFSDQVNNNNQTSVVIKGVKNGTLSCNDCGSTSIVAEPPKGWKIILIFVLQLFILITFVVIAFFFISIILERECEKCYEIGYRDGKKEAVAEFKSQYVPPANIDGIADEFNMCTTVVDGVCEETEDTFEAMRWARYFLHRGDAENALVSHSSPNKQIFQRRARRFYRSAIDIGSGVGAQAAIYAAKRIQYQSMTCIYDNESLARISRNWPNNAQSLGELIEMKQKQTALKALGYYNGDVDNRHGGKTRTAVRDFQADLGQTQNGVLNAEQTVLLICGGAQIAKDIESQNVLGIMYATGLGVRQNLDFALNWLEAAEQRGDADASWNLALLYGTGTVLHSVNVCGAVQNPERADSYLRDAARRGHPAAQRARNLYPNETPELRWEKLKAKLRSPTAVLITRPSCEPNP